MASKKIQPDGESLDDSAVNRKHNSTFPLSSFNTSDSLIMSSSQSV